MYVHLSEIQMHDIICVQTTPLKHIDNHSFVFKLIITKDVSNLFFIKASYREYDFKSEQNI